MMKYRDIEFSSFKALSAASGNGGIVAGVVVTGQAAIKSETVNAAEKAIDRAFALKKVRLIPPEDKG